MSKQFYEQDLQLQTSFSDGRSSVEELVLGSIANGRTIVGITDHALGWTEGKEDVHFFMTPDEFQNYLSDIKAAKEKYQPQGVNVLAGLEVEIGFDGAMWLAPGIQEVVGNEDTILQQLDYTIGVIHSESFSVSLEATSTTVSADEKLHLLMHNIAALIANPNITVWGHPFQAIHGHFQRHFTAEEQDMIVGLLQARSKPLLIEYNLNPYPRYEEWRGLTNLYAQGTLTPNDMRFFERCAAAGTTFVISTDGHDIEQTGRLSPTAKIPQLIQDHLVFLEADS